MLERLLREIATREFSPQLFTEYRRLLREVEEQYEKLEFFLARFYHEMESRESRIESRRESSSEPEFNLDRLLRDAQKAESQLPVLTILLKIFQVCPMMGEPSVYEQMKHYSKCSQCFSYIRKEPGKEKLHPFLRGFLVYCYRENLLRNLEQEVPLDKVQDNFPMIIQQWGIDLFRAFDKYVSETLPQELEKDYLEFKTRTYRR